MIEQTCDLWAPHATPEHLLVRCITTNGDVNRFGEAVMGRGVAKQTISRVSEMPHILGTHLRKNGNVILEPKSFYLNGSVNIISPLLDFSTPKAGMRQWALALAYS